MDPMHVIDDFLDDATAVAIVSAHRRRRPQLQDSDNVVYLSDFPDVDRGAITHAVQRVEAEAARLYDRRDLVPETILVAAIPTGPFHHVYHCDNCRVVCRAHGVDDPRCDCTDDVRIDANHTPARVITAALYLDAAHKGGQLIIGRGAGRTIEAQRGRLVMYPSDHHYPHRTMPVTSGVRFALFVFFKRKD